MQSARSVVCEWIRRAQASIHYTPGASASWSKRSLVSNGQCLVTANGRGRSCQAVKTVNRHWSRSKSAFKSAFSSCIAGTNADAAFFNPSDNAQIVGAGLLLAQCFPSERGQCFYCVAHTIFDHMSVSRVRKTSRCSRHSQPFRAPKVILSCALISLSCRRAFLGNGSFSLVSLATSEYAPQRGRA